jgi:hypothetical protein
MARHYVGINKASGLDPSAVTLGTSTTSKDIEISTLDGVPLTKMDVENALSVFEAYFAKNDVPA